MTALINVLNAYGKRQPTLNEIYDFSRYLKVYADNRPPNGKTAVVVEKDVHYGISRMVGMFVEFEVPYQVEVFRSLDKACQWIDEEKPC